MSEPTTSYQARYPGDLYPGNTQRERSQSNDRLVALARDYNIHDEEIRALQAFLGLPLTPFDPSGPRPGTGDTLVDKITSIGGTAGCLEDGTLCHYADPTFGIDPTARTFINTTAAIGTVWINPTAIPSGPTPPPIPPTDVPWPGPGGNPNPNPGNPVPGAPGPMPGPAVPPFGGGGDVTWFLRNRLILGNYFQTMAQYRLFMQSAETIGFWPRPFTDLFGVLKSVVNLLNDWPSGRQEPNVSGRVSIFDVLTPTSVLAQLLLKGLGIRAYTGSISGTNIIFNTAGNRLDTGAVGSAVGDILVVLSNSKSVLFDPSNFTALQRHPSGVSVLGTGEVEGATSSFRIVGATAFPTNAEVLVFTFNGLPKKSTQGDSNGWREETVAGGPSFVLTNEPTDGRGSRPVLVLYGQVAPGGAWTPLNYNGGAAATGANDFGITAPQTINTFGPTGYTMIRALYEIERL